MNKLFVLSLLVGIALSFTVDKSRLTSHEIAMVNKAARQDVNGWIYLTLSGDPYTVGFQHGSLIAAEFAQAMEAYEYFTYQGYGFTFDWFNEQAVLQQLDDIYDDLLLELQGITDGINKQGYNFPLQTIIGYNAYQEMTGYWWPTVVQQYSNASTGPGRWSKSHCSAFVATGSATTDGKIVIGHQTFTEFWNGQFLNAIIDITPTSGNRIVYQGAPGWVGSGTDFWINSAGLVVVETTIVGYVGYDATKIPEWVRVRNATQYANSISDWTSIMMNDNNGGYANMWLLGDINTGEIANLELGLVYQNLTVKTDGTFYGENAPNDARIRNLECSDVGFSDTRQQTGARRVRWPQMLNQYNGKINATVGQIMLGDTYDVYLGKVNPSSRTICSHYDQDPMYYVSDPNAVWNVPFYPAGSVDGKVTTANLAANMQMWGIFGRADGAAFDATTFLANYPQWNWQAPYLQSRPAQPWTFFNGQ